MVGYIKKFVYKDKKGITTERRVFVISENNKYLTGIELNYLSSSDEELFLSLFKNRTPDRNVVFRRERDQKLNGMKGLKKEWIKAHRTFLKRNIKNLQKELLTKTEKSKKIEKQTYYQKIIGQYKKFLKSNMDNPEESTIKEETRKETSNNNLQNLQKQDSIQNKIFKHYNKALQLEEHGQYKEAIKYYDKTIALNPNNSEYYKVKHGVYND